MKRFTHLLYCPWTGLGLYGGFRGNRWLKNRLKIFRQFVLPALRQQTNRNFILWCSWRLEEKNNKIVRQFMEEMGLVEEFRTVHTFHGVCFWDDKYEPMEARSRLLTSLHGSIGDLLDTIGDTEEVLMTIQPSDDSYFTGLVELLQRSFLNTNVQAIGFKSGYIMNYLTGELAEYNPQTNPPFYTIRFSKEDFIDPLRHAQYTSLKYDVGKYKRGTPLPSHEYVKDCLMYIPLNQRGFLVGTHGENISTHFNHPYKGRVIEGKEKTVVLSKFGLAETEPLKIRLSFRKIIMRRLPFKWQRKLRYVLGERGWHRIYEWLRS